MSSTKKNTSGYGNKFPWYTPTIWVGGRLSGWLRLLARNRWRVSPSRWHLVLINTLGCAVNSVLALVERVVYGPRVRRTPVPRDPLFIIGHWRTGTTLLHELLILDPRHTYPNNYHCMAPNHFLLTERWFTRLFRFLMPKHRPMDNMAMGWEKPQEEEFALCNLGLPSPYLTIAFPNHPPHDGAYFRVEEVPADAREAWKQAFLRFAQHLTFREPKRLVLKSPPNTARVKILLEMFPEARFIHIVRDPYVVFSSTMHLWRSLYWQQGLQVPRLEGLEQYVFETFLALHRALDEARPLLPEGRFCELRYEDLVADPVGQLRKLYEALELGDIDPALPALEEYAAGMKQYRTNRYEIDEQLQAEITRRWGEQIRRWGYGREDEVSAGYTAGADQSTD